MSPVGGVDARLLEGVVGGGGFSAAVLAWPGLGWNALLLRDLVPRLVLLEPNPWGQARLGEMFGQDAGISILAGQVPGQLRSVLGGLGGAPLLFVADLPATLAPRGRDRVVRELARMPQGSVAILDGQLPALGPASQDRALVELVCQVAGARPDWQVRASHGVLVAAPPELAGTLALPPRRWGAATPGAPGPEAETVAADLRHQRAALSRDQQVGDVRVGLARAQSLLVRPGAPRRWPVLVAARQARRAAGRARGHARQVRVLGGARLAAGLALRQHDPRPLAGLLAPAVAGARFGSLGPPLPTGVSWPTISIITPSLDQARFLPQALDSVLGQGYPKLEYLVQDGGSQDDSPAILAASALPRDAWQVCADGGQAEALNRGFARSTGEILAWLNSDDLLLPGALERVARYFLAHPEVDVLYGDRVVIDEQDQVVGTWILPRHDDRVLAWADYVPQETLFWRRRAWQAVGERLDESWTFALDWDLLLRLQRAGARIVHLPVLLGAFRLHGDSKTSTALDTVGAREMARMRRSVHGREVSEREVHRALRSFRIRVAAARAVAHARARLGSRTRGGTAAPTPGTRGDRLPPADPGR